MHSAMEQTRYWMWTRRKFLDSPTLSVAAAGSSYNESWEEQAFAEDSAGHLGGCVWPPRSYSCSFCRREFRSAQALGGHMNVHRRDRARLKQVSSPSGENHEADHRDHQLNPCTLPMQVSTLVHNPNPNPNPNPNHGGRPSAPSPSRVSAACTQENRSDRTITDSIAGRLPLTTVLELRLGRENRRRRRDRSDEDDAEDISRKRWKGDSMVTFSLSTIPSPSGQQLVESEVLKLKPSPVEELDLELRLGDPPKVK